MSETPNTSSESPAPLRKVLLDIDAVVEADEAKRADVAARDLDDERQAARDKLADLHEVDASLLDPAAVEAAKRELLQVEAERLSRGGNPDTR